MLSNLNERYKSQSFFIDNAMQDKLASTKVLCVGAGGLGTLVTAYLVAAGVGEITIADSDTIEISNLTRQIIYTESDCGKYKVEVLKSYLNKLNSSVVINAINEHFNFANANSFVKSHDFIIDCTDNAIARYLVSDTCNDLRKTLICGSVSGFDGIVLVLKHNICYRCIFPSCYHENGCVNGNVFGPSVGIVANLIANESLKVMTNFSWGNKLIKINALENIMNSYNITSDLKCVNCHGDDLLDYVHTIKSIKFEEIEDIAKNNEIVIIDLRNNPYNSVDKQPLLYNRLNLSDFHAQNIDFTQYIIVICELGIRSKITALNLASVGYINVYHLGTQVL